MQRFITIIAKAFRYQYTIIRLIVNKTVSWWLFYSNNATFKKVDSNGIPYIMVASGGKLIVGNNFRINNGLLGNPIGRPQKCVFIVDRQAKLRIGDHVGMSSTAIVAHQEITIGDHVKIGGGVCIYDTDFHSLDSKNREQPSLDRQFENKQPVTIEDHVFIGAHATILKGVRIGKNSIIGACSVVTKSIPPNEIWAGNPARFIKNISPND